MTEFAYTVNHIKETPTLTKNYENDGILHFVVKDAPLAIVNGIRRTILSDIPVVVIRTENSKINQCQITTNTSRFHNEIVKQRLSSIPIITKDLDTFPQNYKLLVEGKNTSDYEMKYVTTDDFKIQHKESGQFLDETEILKLFPHDPISNRPIDFLRLRPKMGPTIPGESLELTAEFSVSTAQENGMFNAVSKCAFFNVIDPEKRDVLWSQHLQIYNNENRTKEEIAFEEKNFQYLDAHRCYKTNEDDEPNEFEFVVKTIGQYSNYEIVEKACHLLMEKIKRFQSELESDVVPIQPSNESKQAGYTSVVSANVNSYDIVLEEEDYTLGNILEHFLYKLFYTTKSSNKPELTFVGFKKYHPHDDYSVIRLMSPRFSDDNNAITNCKQYLITSCRESVAMIEVIRKKFAR